MLLLYNCVFVKERLDFSCAMFGPTGGLVANGPHVPMHLGSMQETVKYQVCYILFVTCNSFGSPLEIVVK